MMKAATMRGGFLMRTMARAGGSVCRSKRKRGAAETGLPQMPQVRTGFGRSSDDLRVDARSDGNPCPARARRWPSLMHTAHDSAPTSKLVQESPGLTNSPGSYQRLQPPPLAAGDPPGPTPRLVRRLRVWRREKPASRRVFRSGRSGRRATCGRQASLTSASRRASFAFRRARIELCIWLTRLSESASVTPISFMVISS